MKSKPDDMTLTQWMDGELEGNPLRRVEAWAEKHPELLAEREAVQAMSARIRQHVPDSIEPPYPDFFNQRIQRAIAEKTQPSKKSRKNSQRFWQWLAMPLAAGAMAICFYLGTQATNPAISPETQIVVTQPVTDSSVYTPDGSVRADMFKSKEAKAVVIVLEGLDDIPDHLEMVGEPLIDSTRGKMIKTGSSNNSF